jgi:O-antigen ligase
VIARLKESRSLLVPWLAASVLAGALVAYATPRGLLEMSLMAVVVLVAGVAMLSSLRVAVVLAVASVPLEDFLVFDSAGTITKLVVVGLAGSYVFHLMRGRIRARGGAVSTVGWLWLAWACASLAWASDPQVGHVTSLLQLFLLAYVVASIVAERPLMAPTILWTYALSASVTALLGVTRFFTMAQSTGAVRASATDGQGVEHFGAYLIPALILALLVSTRSSKSPAWRIPAVLLAVLLMTGMLVSGTRSAWLAVIVAVLVLVIPRMRWGQLLSFAVAVAILLITALQVPTLSEFVVERSIAAAKTGGAGRLDIWKVGLGLISESPIIGVSYAQFPDYFVPQNIVSTPLTLEHGFLDMRRAPHSIYLSNVVELGAVGILLFLVWMWPLVLRLEGRGVYLIIIRATLFAYLLQGIYLDILNRKYFWLFVGLAEGCRYLVRARSVATSANAGRRAEAPSG